MFIILFVSLIVISCNNNSKNENITNNSIVKKNIKNKTIVGKTFHTKSEDDIYMQTKPHGDGENVLNVQATIYYGKNTYYRVRNIDEICILEEEGEWVKVKHVKFPENTGWIEKKNIQFKKNKIEENPPLTDKEYLLVKVTSTAIKNFYILAKKEISSKNQALLFIKRLQKNKNFNNANVYIFDDLKALKMFDKQTLIGKDYIYVAEHFIAMSTFDSKDNIWWLPYIDDNYKNYGGKKSKK